MNQVRTIVPSSGRLNFLPEGFVEALQRCEVDGKVAAPALPGKDERPTSEQSTNYGALIAAMVAMPVHLVVHGATHQQQFLQAQLEVLAFIRRDFRLNPGR